MRQIRRRISRRPINPSRSMLRSRITGELSPSRTTGVERGKQRPREAFGVFLANAGGAIKAEASEWIQIRAGSAGCILLPRKKRVEERSGGADLEEPLLA